MFTFCDENCDVHVWFVFLVSVWKQKSVLSACLQFETVYSWYCEKAQELFTSTKVGIALSKATLKQHNYKWDKQLCPEQFLLDIQHFDKHLS
jgi:hypothetical protein